MTLQAALSNWLPAGIRFAVTDARESYPLIGAEADAVARAIPKRQCAFSAGRHAARLALGQMDTEIPVGAKRAPIWPQGLCGSITHSDTICIAICAPTSQFASVGIDAEEDIPLKDALRQSILHADEQRLSGEEAIAAFSRKEALFKALYPLAQQWFGFQAACTDGDGLRLTRDVGIFAAGRHFDVPLLRRNGHLITLCTVKGLPG